MQSLISESALFFRSLSYTIIFFLLVDFFVALFAVFACFDSLASACVHSVRVAMSLRAEFGNPLTEKLDCRLFWYAVIDVLVASVAIVLLDAVLDYLLHICLLSNLEIAVILDDFFAPFADDFFFIINPVLEASLISLSALDCPKTMLTYFHINFLSAPLRDSLSVLFILET